jgi:arylformamidase
MPSSHEPRLYDLSRPLTATTACWPGDVPFSFRLGWRIRDGASVNVGAVETSVHTATHCDAPYHYDDAGPTVARLPLETFLGPTWIVDVRGCDRWRDRLVDLEFADTPRVLFHTGGWPDTTRFPDRVPVMEPDLPDWLGDRGVLLVGVDLVIVEGLWLEEVPGGRYELIALPLKIDGADGSPLRAVVRCPI